MSNYRSAYIKRSKSALNLHICAYCAKPLLRGNMTVDHIIPQNLFKKIKNRLIGLNVLLAPLAYFVDMIIPFIALTAVSAVLIFLLTMFRDSRLNTISACKACNSSKKDKINFKILVAMIMSPLVLVFDLLTSKVGLAIIAIGIVYYKFFI